MGDFVVFIVSIIIVAGVLYVNFKIWKFLFKSLKSLFGGKTTIPPINENQLAELTRAKFESLNELEVLKFVMERTGWTLAKSQAFCDKLKPKNTVAPKTFSSDSTSKASLNSDNHISNEALEIKVREKLVSIGKLEAVNYIIKNTGWSLKESKSFCDKIENELNKESQLNQVSSSITTKIKLSEDVDQINYIIKKTGWNYEKAKAYFEDIQVYEKDSRKHYITK